MSALPVVHCIKSEYDDRAPLLSTVGNGMPLGHGDAGLFPVVYRFPKEYLDELEAPCIVIMNDNDSPLSD